MRILGPDVSPRRFPMDSDEVSLRRVIGLKKDQLYMNGRLASSRTEVQGALEAAGFSSSNPYYIVKQGQISRVACCSPKERLHLVREVAGAGVYTDKRRKAEEELANTQGFLREVGGSLREVTTRVEQLREEKEALEEWRRVDKERRVVEVAMVEADADEARSKLAKCKLADKAPEEVQELEALENRLMEKKKLVEDLRMEKQDVEAEVKIRRQTCEELLARREVLRLEEADMADEAPAEVEEELRSRCQALAGRRDEQGTRLAEVAERADQEEETLARATREREAAYRRLGRSKQFPTREARDAWIQGEVAAIQVGMGEKQRRLEELREDVVEAQGSMKKAERLEETRAEVEERVGAAHGQLTELLRETAELRRRHGAASSQLPELHRRLAGEEAAARSHRARLAGLGGLQQVLQGAESLTTVLQQVPALEGAYHGMVSRCIFHLQSLEIDFFCGCSCDIANYRTNYRNYRVFFFTGGTRLVPPKKFKC